MKLIVILFCRLFSYLSLTGKYEYFIKINKKAQTVVAANHLHALDPLFIMGMLSKNTFRDLRPYAFLTKNRYLHIPILGWILKSIGCFPSRTEGNRLGGLDAAKQLLDKGSRILIFPEGTVVKPGVEYRNHRGVAVLANEPNVQVLPVRIKQRRPGQNIFGSNKIFNNIDVIYGKPFFAQGMTPDEIMERVYSLEP